MLGWVYENDNGNQVCDYYYCMKEDVVFLKQQGVMVYCFFIFWFCILFDGMIKYVNQVGIDFYNQLIDEFLVNGIIFWVIFYYWDLLLVL